MRPIHPAFAEAQVMIGADLRSSRQAQGLTLEQLAAATGLTKGFISRIERDKTLPSVPTLVHLCQTLSLPIASLFTEPDLQLVSLPEAPRVNMGGTGTTDSLITPRAEERVQLLRSTIEPHGSGGEDLYTLSCAVESVHVITGELELLFSDRTLVLSKGDTATFPGQTPHTWRAGAPGAEVVWVLVPASWSASR